MKQSALKKKKKCKDHNLSAGTSYYSDWSIPNYSGILNNAVRDLYDMPEDLYTDDTF